MFKPIWDEITRLVSQDRWKIFSVVAGEIRNPTVQQWLNTNNLAVVNWNDNINQYLNKLMQELQANNMMLVNPNSVRDEGDPFVVMLALYLERRDLHDLTKKTTDNICSVLTTEKSNPNKVKIPSVCQYYGISCMDLPDFMRHHGWEVSVKVKIP